MSRTRAAGYDRSRTILTALVLVLIVGVHATLIWLAREPGLLTGQDDAEYILLGRSILDGGYNDIFRLDAPPHRTYPPVYPAALAVWGTLFGERFDSFIAMNLVVSGLSLIVLFFALRHLFGVPLALSVVAVLSLNPIVIEYAGAVRSEPLFILLALVALGALLIADPHRPRAPPANEERRGEVGSPGADPAKRRRPVAWIGLAVVTMLVATMTRSIGVTLIAAIVLHLLLQGRWRTVGIPAIAVVVAVGAWLLWTAAGSEQYVGSSYIAELKSLWAGTSVTGPLPGRAVRFARAYARHGLPWSLGFPTIAGTAVDNAILLILIGTCGAMGLVVFFRRWRPAALWILGYGAFLTIWIFYVDRFVIPIVPLLTACILSGAYTLGRRIGGRTTIVLTAGVAVILGLGAILQLRSLLGRRIGCDRSAKYPDPACISADQRAYFDALRWIESNTPSDAVFLTAKSGALYLYTGRRSIAFDPMFSEAPDRLVAAIRGRGADWILLSGLYAREHDALAPRLRATCEQLALDAVFAPSTLVFRLDQAQPAADATEPAACSALDAYLLLPWEPARLFGTPDGAP